jgi:hypothetical protein
MKISKKKKIKKKKKKKKKKKNIIDSLGARQLEFFFLSHCKVKGLAISL